MQRTAIVVGVLFVGCLEPSTECRGASCSTGSVESALPSGDLCAALAEELSCGQWKKCGLADPDAGCQAVLRGSRNAPPSSCWHLERESVDAGRLRYDAKVARDCLTAHERRSCTDVAPIDACLKMWTGLQPVGASCTIDLDCVTGAWCDFTATCPGVCRALGQVGAIVSNYRGCHPSSSAVSTDGGWRCGPPALTGEPCGDHFVLGKACAADEDVCVHPPDGGTGRCERYVPRPLPAKSGEPCGRDRECQLGLACRPSTQTEGRCGALFAPGEACSFDPRACVPGTFCNSGTCEAAPAVGSACSSTCARGALCLGGTCRAEAGEGGACPCMVGLECAAGVCRAPTCR